MDATGADAGGMARTAKSGGVRAAKAAANRARMLAAARDLFVAQGYASTSMQAIAKQAGMAVQTLYFTFATKRAILTEVLDVEIAGDTEPVATLDRPWVAEALAADPAGQLRLQAAASARILTRVAPILEAVRSTAAHDPEIAELWQTNIAQRLTVQTRFAEALAAKTGLRAGIGTDRAADLMLAAFAPEAFHLLVHERGWQVAEWEANAGDTLIRQLLPDGPQSG
ncbi:TetR/AcrR family transcriptional regulator [Yinghuangia soli]|uniref:TetR/AcrR family transcriptional regulator n=1 Tax=Yinghuangia soli TaxID=2908204 RepID=A0AA41TYN2_9ACTN|nr:TetR/AcrR family transcriptional regulator [Yinghuangia soli]MCF2526576.1 TetR/AcrR family transcriptional regulator [Yinghuangia soli]